MRASALQEVSDGKLWELAAGNDPAAVGVLFQRHANSVYTHCFRRTASWSAAEDLTSVVFLEAWRCSAAGAPLRT